MAASALAAFVYFAGPTRLHAQEPRYLISLSELRTARDYIEADHREVFEHERHHAVDEINKAIDEIKHAAWDDGKQTKYAPPPHPEADPWHPMRQAVNWLDGARGHVMEGFDRPENQGLRERAVEHIDDARRTLWEIIRREAR